MDSDSDHVKQVQARYGAERDKRMRVEGIGQYIKLHESPESHQLGLDPWLPADGSVPGMQLSDGQSIHSKFVIKGAGYGALIYAAKLVEAGQKADDILFVDDAGGFGGTWYWNRYPGLMCDVAGMVYIPMLEQTGYIPKHKYSYGQELRAYGEQLAKHYGFDKHALFRTTVSEVIWNDERLVWEVSVSQQQGPQKGKDTSKVSTKIDADFVVSMSGLLNHPKVPKVEGIKEFEGAQMHASRWNYNITGGSQEKPDLTKLQDKSVAVIGTGASAIQFFPHVAKWAKQAYLFQRTPSSVDVRGQEETDVEAFKKVASEPGWQRKASDNLAAHVLDVPDKPEVNIINDAWTGIPSFKALTGGPNSVDPTKPETIGAHIQNLHALDFPRQERIRKRVDEIVKDPKTAENLKPWFPGWCKRPCFHDDFLPVFNRANVQLVDTDGRGIERLTRDGIVADGKEYKVDVIIWGTGFAFNSGSIDSRGKMVVRGRSGKLLSEKWYNNLATLHGVFTHDFPNFFFPTTQCGTTINNTHINLNTAEQTAFVIQEAERRNPGKKVVIEPSVEAEEEWAMKIVAGAAAFAGMSGCTPSYYTGEGAAEKIAQAPPEEQMKAARMSIWSQGVLDYQRVLYDWRANGDFKGVEVTVA